MRCPAAAGTKQTPTGDARGAQARRCTGLLWVLRAPEPSILLLDVAGGCHWAEL